MVAIRQPPSREIDDTLGLVGLRCRRDASDRGPHPNRPLCAGAGPRDVSATCYRLAGALTNAGEREACEVEPSSTASHGPPSRFTLPQTGPLRGFRVADRDDLLADLELLDFEVGDPRGAVHEF